MTRCQLADAQAMLDRLASGVGIRTTADDERRLVEAAVEAAGVRVALRDAGYVPIPLYGKAPPNIRNNDHGGLSGWQHTTTVSDDLLIEWAIRWPDATNTGVLTARMPTLDADIRNEAAACAVEALVRGQYEKRGRLLMRIGQPPKRAFPFRTAQPFGKTTIYFVGDEKLEFLGDGQQVVADGIHPDTAKPYTWFGAELFQVARAELPEITAAEARELMEQAAELLVKQFGYVRGGGQIGSGGGMSPDRDALMQNILDGTNLHDSLCSLAAKLAAAGVASNEAIDFLQDLMLKSRAPDDRRWQDRYDDIPRLVESGEKFAPIKDRLVGCPVLRDLVAKYGKKPGLFAKRRRKRTKGLGARAMSKAIKAALGAGR